MKSAKSERHSPAIPWRDLGVFAAPAVLYICLSISEESFRGWENFRNVLSQISIVAIVSVGMTAVIISGGIDLSVGSIAALSACTAGVMMANHHWGGASGLLTALAIGAGLGCFNGFAITKANLPPFVATLATMVMARGMAFVVSGGGAIYKLAPAFVWPGSGNLLDRLPVIDKLPFIIVLMASIYAVGMVILQRLRLGRYIYSVGSNEEATRLSGVPVGNVKMLCYTTCGLLAGLAGILYSGYVGAAEPTIGDGLELDVIAAVVIGGTSLNGGQGNLPGTFAGALLIGLVKNGLNLKGYDANYQRVVVGAIILLAVMFDLWQKKRRRA